MFANNNASRSFTSLTIDEIRWLNASNALGNDGDSIRSVPSGDLVKSHSVAKPKNSRPRYGDSRRRSILLDNDFLGSSTLSRTPEHIRTKFGLGDTPPPSPDESLPSSPLAASHSTETQDRVATPESPSRPKAWLYRRPRSPSSLSRSPSSLSNSPSLSRTSSSSRSVTPTPARIRPPTGYRPHTASPIVTEMNQSPFWSTVTPPRRSPSIRARTPSSRGRRSPSHSSPNLVDLGGSPRSKRLADRPPPLPIQRERSGSESSSISTSTTSSTGSLPSTPPSPGSVYSQHSFAYPHPDTRSTTPTKSILSRTPKRSPSVSTKHSSTNKSVKFDEVPAIRYAGYRFPFGDGMVRDEESNSQEVDSMGMDLDGMDPPETPTPTGKNRGDALKRFWTLGSRNKTKPRPEISGPYALARVSAASQPHHSEHATSHITFGGAPPTLTIPFNSSSAASSFVSQSDVGTIPSSPNGGTETDRLGSKPKKPSSLIGSGDIPSYQGRFFSNSNPNKYYTHPAPRSKTPKAASVAGSGDVGVLASEPVLHALPSMESFRSAKSSWRINWHWPRRMS